MTQPLTKQSLARRYRGSFAIVAALALTFSATSALASVSMAKADATTRTRRVSTSQQPQTPGSKTQAERAAPKAGTAKKPKTGSGKASSEKPAEKATHAKPKPQAKGKKRKHQQEESDDDPILIHRARGVVTLHKAPQKLIALSHPQGKAKPIEVAVSKQPAPPLSPPTSSPALPPIAPTKRTATVDDFVRAAGQGDLVADDVSAGDPANATGQSHPDDDEMLPAHAVNARMAKPVISPVVIKPVVKATPQPPIVAVAAVSNDTPHAAPIERRTPPERIDGFGAEGAMLTLPATSVENPRPVKAAKSRKPIETPVQEDPELAAIEHPSKEDLAIAAALPQVTMKYSRNGHLIMPAPLKGSHEILVHQNTMADDEGLDRIQDDDDLDRLRAKHLLVGFSDTAALRINPDLPENRRAARPWTVKFSEDMARGYYAKFHQPLTLSSAVRTVAYQLRLQRINGNAASVDGEGASPHLTGQAVDFAKHGMSIAQIAWMRAYLLPLINAGKVDVEEEFQQACFHISVYKNYLPSAKKKPAPRTEVASAREPRLKALVPDSDSK